MIEKVIPVEQSVVPKSKIKPKRDLSVKNLDDLEIGDVCRSQSDLVNHGFYIKTKIGFCFYSREDKCLNIGIPEKNIMLSTLKRAESDISVLESIRRDTGMEFKDGKFHDEEDISKIYSIERSNKEEVDKLNRILKEQMEKNVSLSTKISQQSDLIYTQGKTNDFLIRTMETLNKSIGFIKRSEDCE